MFIKGIVQLFKILHIKERTAEHFSYGEGGGNTSQRSKRYVVECTFLIKRYVVECTFLIKRYVVECTFLIKSKENLRNGMYSSLI